MGQLLLVVDDSRTVCRAVQLVFHASMYEVVSCGSSAEAIQIARARRPVALIVDYMLPDGSGFDLVRRLRHEADLSETPVLMLTGRYHAFDPREVEACGADGSIAKPFKTDDLISALATATNRPRHRPVQYTPAADAAPAVVEPDQDELALIDLAPAPDEQPAGHWNRPAAITPPPPDHHADHDDLIERDLRTTYPETGAPLYGGGAPAAPIAPPAPAAAASAGYGAPLYGSGPPASGPVRRQPDPTAVTAYAPYNAEALHAHMAPSAQAAHPGEPAGETGSAGFRRLRPAGPPPPPNAPRRVLAPPTPGDAAAADTAPRIDLPEISAPAPGPVAAARTVEQPAIAAPATRETSVVVPLGDDDLVAPHVPNPPTAPTAQVPMPAAPNWASSAPSHSPATVATPSPSAAPAPQLDEAALREMAREMIAPIVKDLLPAIVKEYLATMLRQTGQKLDEYSRQKIDLFVQNELPRMSEAAVADKLVDVHRMAQEAIDRQLAALTGEGL